MSPLQLPLGFAVRPALGREDFLVAPGNAEAVAWIDRWPDWPHHALAVIGPAGCGKTHLSHLFATHAGATRLSLDGVGDPLALFDATAAAVIEDLDRAPDGFDEEALLHLYNAAREAGRHLWLSARRPPAQWRVRLPDLASRLATVPTVSIGAPDDAMLAAVLTKLFADRQLRVNGAVISYMVARMERSFAAARATVGAVDREALAAGRPVTVPLVRRVLERTFEDGQ